MLKGKNALLIGGLVLLAAVLMLAAGKLAPGTKTAEDLVVIRVDGKEFARVPLSDPQTVRVEQDNGAVNVVVVTAEGAYMEEATCPDKTCVLRGAVTKENWEYRPDGAFIVCLPNRVTVELAVAE